MIVLDASCLIDVLLQTPDVAPVEARIRAGDGLHAPELIDLEVLQVLRRLVTGRTVSADRAHLAVGALGRLALRRWPHGALRRRIWELRGNLTAYDASYVALAERLACPMVTRDARLARAAGHRARIDLL